MQPHILGIALSFGEGSVYIHQRKWWLAGKSDFSGVGHASQRREFDHASHDGDMHEELGVRTSMKLQMQRNTFTNNDHDMGICMDHPI